MDFVAILAKAIDECPGPWKFGSDVDTQGWVYEPRQPVKLSPYGLAARRVGTDVALDARFSNSEFEVSGWFVMPWPIPIGVCGACGGRCHVDDYLCYECRKS